LKYNILDKLEYLRKLAKISLQKNQKKTRAKSTHGHDESGYGLVFFTFCIILNRGNSFCQASLPILPSTAFYSFFFPLFLLHAVSCLLSFSVYSPLQTVNCLLHATSCFFNLFLTSVTCF